MVNESFMRRIGSAADQCALDGVHTDRQCLRRMPLLSPLLSNWQELTVLSYRGGLNGRPRYIFFITLVFAAAVALSVRPEPGRDREDRRRKAGGDQPIFDRP